MHRSSRVVPLVAVLTLFLGFVFAVQAAGDGPATRTIPFQGALELDGTPASGAYNIVVTLHDDETAGSELFSEPHTITASAGKFSLVIGANAPLPDAALEAAELFASVSVEGVALDGRQKIHAAARVMDPPQFNAGRLHSNYVEITPTEVGGLSGWDIAVDIIGQNGAIRLEEGNVQLGLHDSGSVFVSDTRGAGIQHPIELQQDGDILADGDFVGQNVVARGTVSANTLQVGGAAPIRRIEAGVVGNCSGPALPFERLVEFDGAFASPPVVALTPGEYDNAGCTDVRLINVTSTTFRFNSYTGNNVLTGCGCVHWVAIGK